MTTLLQKGWNWLVKKNVGKSDDDAFLNREYTGDAIEEFNELFNEKPEEKGLNSGKIEERKAKYTTMINHYYSLVTDFYEYGWGESFHFATRFKGESFAASLARHEQFLALRAGLKPGMKALDLGCGVGGPMRCIARFSGANVVGINNCAYQVKRCNILNERYGLAHLCSVVKGDFMKLPFEDNSFDVVYAVEATCHAPDRVKCFSEALRVLKPGGVFVGYEWCMTPLYNPKDEQHRIVKHKIEHGDSLPELTGEEVIVDALEKAGFELLENYDAALEAPKNGNDVGWWTTLEGQLTLANLKHTKLGRFMTQTMVDVLETIKIAPKGTSATHKMLCIAADALALGGGWGIFTPMYYFNAQKPQ